jgi:hypothetical protein
MREPGRKILALKVVELIDQGKTFEDIRRLDPSDFGVTYPR